MHGRGIGGDVYGIHTLNGNPPKDLVRLPYRSVELHPAPRQEEEDGGPGGTDVGQQQHIEFEGWGLG